MKKYVEPEGKLGPNTPKASEVGNVKMLCDTCLCNPVCSIKNSYSQIQTAIDDLTVNVDGVTKLYDIPWIKNPIVVPCIHYRSEWGARTTR